jgi:hypothetical protein
MDAYRNFSYSTVATAPSPATTGTSLVVFAGDGSKFPAVPFNAVIWPTGQQPTVTNAEIVRVTNRATDTLTITRTQESTSARTVVVGDQIAAAFTAKLLDDLPGREVTHNEVTSSTSVTATTEATANTVVTATAFTADGSTPVLIEFYAPSAFTDGAAVARVLSIWLYLDGASIGKLGQLTTPAASNMEASLHLMRKLTPAAGSRTYSVRASVNAGTGGVAAGAGGLGNAMPSFIRITKA